MNKNLKKFEKGVDKCIKMQYNMPIINFHSSKGEKRP
jgi:hypothetical protein